MSNFNKLNKILSIVIIAVCCMFMFGCGKEDKLDGVWGQSDATEVDVNTKITGRLVNLYVKEGSIVKKGQLLAQIDSREQAAKYMAAKAQLEAAKSVAEQAKANLDNTSKDTARFQKLYENGATSMQNYDTYNTKYKVALATYEAACQNVKAAEESLAQVNISLNETDLVAPFDGIIVNKYVDPGAMISTGMPIVAVQAPLDNWADFKVKETELSKYKEGDEVTVIGRDPNLKLKGKIVNISRKPNFASYRSTTDRGDGGDIIAYNVKVSLNSDKIRPGMRVRLVQGE